MTEHDVHNILRESLFEFPVLEVNVNLPSWVMVLRNNHWLRKNYEETIHETVKNIKRLRDVHEITEQFSEYDFIAHANLSGLELGDRSEERRVGKESRGRS